MRINAYVDGSYDSNTNVYGGGAMLEIENLDTPLELKVFGWENNYARMRNVTGELLAAMKAMEVALQFKSKHVTSMIELHIYYDYEGIEKWTLPVGHPKRWEARKTLTKDYVAMVRELRKFITIEFHHVKAHTGVKGNERADRLAKDACKEGAKAKLEKE